MIELQKEPLRPLVVVGISRVDFPTPVERKPHGRELLFEIVDIFFGCLLRRNPVFECVIFGGKTERVPSHRVEHVVALHPSPARHNIECYVTP